MSKEYTRVDGLGRTVLVQKDPAKGAQQLPPYCLPTYDVETLDRNHGSSREAIPPLGKEWTANR